MRFSHFYSYLLLAGLSHETAVFGAGFSEEDRTLQRRCTVEFYPYEKVEDDACSDPTGIMGNGIFQDESGLLKKLLDSNVEVSWRDCCRRHDFHYWMGGGERTHALAELELARCIASSISIQGEGVARVMERVARKSVEVLGRTGSWITEKNKNLHDRFGVQLSPGRHGSFGDHLWGAGWSPKPPKDGSISEGMRCQLEKRHVRRQICDRAIRSPGWPCRNKAICRNPGEGLDPRPGIRNRFLEIVCSERESAFGVGEFHFQGR